MISYTIFKSCIQYVTGFVKTRHVARTHIAQCVFLVPQVENSQIPVFVIFMSKNLSTNLCHHLWRVNLSYQGEISLRFDLPSLYSCCTQNPLPRTLIRIPVHGLSRFVELLYVHSPFKLLRHQRSGSCYQQQSLRLARPFVLIERLGPCPFN